MEVSMCIKRYHSCLFSVILFACAWISPLRADSVVVFNEIMYHPGPTQTAGEWIELHNQMAVDVDLSGWSIRGGVDYTFPEGTFLEGGGYLLVAEIPAALESAAGVTGVLGPFGGQLSNSGESLRLENSSSRLMDAMEYNDKGGWPVAPDGSGVTLAKKKNNQASTPAENWTWSDQVGGTPAAENFPIVDLRPRHQELVAENDSWRFNIQGGNLGQTWRQTAYNDSGWQQGQAGFYYGNNLISSEPEVIPTLFNSGLNEAGNLLTPGQSDPHYWFVSNGQPVIAMQNHPAWLANSSLSQWIGFSAQGTDNQAPGQFNIATTFDLTGFDPDTAAITIYLAVDNRVDDVLINGVSTGIACAGFAGWFGPYVISAGFVEGINELQFVFVNEGTDWNPAGLRVELDGTAIASLGQTQLASCPMTSYFRKSFMYEKPGSTTFELQLEGLVDDGAVFYLNNTEIYRSNMPAGTINYNDAAVSNVTNPQTTGTITLPGDALVDGFNTLAVEVHQAVGGLNDLFFLADLSVTETPIPPVEEMSLAWSEIPANTAEPFWLEIVNEGSQGVNLAGVVISLNGNSSTQYVFSSQMIASKAYLAINETLLGFHPAKDDKVFLYTPQQDAVLDAATVKDVPQARLTAGKSPWYHPQTLSPGQANTVQLNSNVVINEIMYHKGDIVSQPGQYATTALVSAGAAASVLIPASDSLGRTWTGGNEPFDDSAWTAGTGNTTGIGYDRDPDYLTDIGTNIYSQMYNIRQSFYTRISFERTNRGVVDTMTLKMKYDDGFIAYLNGQKIAERNAPVSPVYNSPATASHESYGYETIDVSTYIYCLKNGENILAIHGLNYGLTSSDLLILPELTIHEEVTPPAAADESPEEWIELYNRGTQPVNLTGWKIDGDVTFSFADNTILNNGNYLVVALDRDLLLAEFPSLTAVGNYEGRLSNTNGMITLLDVNNNIADKVMYYDGMPWPDDADGFNASLELRNPNADNSNAQSWRASNESTKSGWKTYTYRGIAQPSSVSQPDGQWREFVMGMLDAGQVLLDDISVIEDPDGTRIQLIQNGTFETSPGDSKWRMLGTHRHSAVIVDPDNAANHVLRFVATGPTEHMHNHLETTLASGRSIVNGQPYEISFRAKWLSGSNQLNTRLYLSRLAKTTLIEKPRSNGTPGAQNSCYENNPGPVFTNLLHQPAVPKEYEPVSVSVSISDPQTVASAVLYWRLDGQAWNTVSMAAQGSGNFTAVIPPQFAASVVQFYIRAADQQSAVALYPPAGPDSRVLYRVDDGLAATNGLHNFRIIMTAQDDTWMHTDINVMSNDRIGATMIYDEDEIFYDVGVRLKGSQHHRTPSNEVGFNVSFQADQLFRGVHKTVAIDRSEGIGFGQREVLINQAMNHANAVISKYSDLIKVIPLRLEHTSAAELQLARYNDEYLEEQFKNGSNGNLYEHELIYYPITTIGGEEDFKLPLPDSYVGTPLVSLGQDKESYRLLYIAKNNRALDSFDQLIRFMEAFGDTSSAYYENLPDRIDVDQWLSSFAIAIASGAGDNYAAGDNIHNMMLYVRPSDSRVLYFPHDLDIGYNVTRSIVSNSDLSKMITMPGYERLYYGHLYHFLTTSYNLAYMSYWTNHFGQLLAGQNFASHLSFIDQRSQYLLGQINGLVAPKYSFEITDPNTSVDSEFAQVAGKAWIDVREIYLEGIDSPLDVQWSSQGTGLSKVYSWTATVPLAPGVNNLVFKAYGFKGELVGSDTITITSTIQERPLRDFLRITEIMYNPVGGSDYEFVELTNTGSISLDLTYVVFSEGITFAFAGSAVTQLNPGNSVVVVKNAAVFSSRYDTSSIAVAGEFSGKLDNNGEKLTLLGQWNAPVLSLTYNNARGWPLAAAGAGHSLVLRETASSYSPDYGASWRASTYMNGSPGQADPVCPESVLLNEIMAHTDYTDPARPEYDSNDWIELYNPTSAVLTLTSGHWFLSDNEANLKKWAIPQTTIAVGGWVTFDEVSGFHNPITTGFGLDKMGEQVYLSYLPGTWENRVVDCVSFKGQKNYISLGRYPDGGAYWQAMSLSRNASNLSPLPHIVISEIMYHPLEGQFEFVELYNPTAQAITLWDTETNTGWRLDGGITFVFAQTTSIPARGHLVIVPFIPDPTLINQFISNYANVPSEIVGPYSANLSNSGERLALERPEKSDVVGQPDPWVIVDEVIYSDQSPWSSDADGAGASLWRSELTLSGLDPEGWSSAVPSSGTLACDFNADGKVNLSDWVVLAESWMTPPDGVGQIVKGDLKKTDEAVIDINDLMILLENWLWENGH
jgi:hypothetical protein